MISLSGCGGGGGGDTPVDAAVTDGSVVDGATVDGASGDGGTVVVKTPPVIMNCGRTLAPSATTCSVTRPATGGATELVLEGAVLTPGKVYVGGQVLVSAGKVVCAGCDCSGETTYANAAIVTCAEGVISPGLINAHDHITFTNTPPHAPQTRRYAHRHEWRRTCPNDPNTELGTLGTANARQVAWGELRQVLSGTTSIIGSGDADNWARNLDRTAERQEGLMQTAVDFETFPLGDSGSPCQRLTTGCGYPTVPTLASIASRDSYMPHVSEGINLEARNEFMCLSREGNGAHDVVVSKSAFIHSIGLTATDVDAMRTDGASVVWSPRSNIDLYGNTAQVTMMDRMGTRIALGTDWVASGSLNMLRELRCADSMNSDYFDHYFTDEELWLMATRNGAEVAKMDDTIGILSPGLTADIAIFKQQTGRTLHRAVIAAEPQDVALVLRGGTVLTGDDALVAALDPAGMMCDTLDVCSTSKRICVRREMNMSLQDLTMNVANGMTEPPIEPLFYCNTPVNEPTCKPSRPTEYTGDKTADDMDGDGIVNASDNCPTVFNPIRPMDNMAQPNIDGDSVGDVCDPCPLDPNTTTCTRSDPNDPDRDNIPSASDNCPSTPNANQADRDNDMKGDVCDACPDASNPGTAACTLSVHDLRDPALGRAALNTRVSLMGLHVQHVRPQGFYARDAGGRDYAGIYVFTSSVPTAGGTPIVAGMIVNVEGTFVEFQGAVDEITSPTLQIAAMTGGNTTPLVVTTTELTGGTVAAEKLEALLVEVRNVTVKAKPAGDDDFFVTDSPMVENCAGTPFPMCARVSDFLYDSATNNVPMTTLDQTFTKLVGVVDGFAERQAINLRAATDITP